MDSYQSKILNRKVQPDPIMCQVKVTYLDRSLHNFPAMTDGNHLQ